MRRSWISSTATLLLCAGLTAEAGQRDRRQQASAPQEPPPAQARPDVLEIFAAPLPIDPGALPEGLANASAQGCHACHYEAHAGWSGSGHATGFASEVLDRAAAEAGTPACRSCHLPLQNQHSALATFEGADPSQPIWTDNPSWDATLSQEGVTCAACHIRDGRVLVARPDVGDAPHPTAWAPELGEATLCATCHQLTWPGATTPFYDTYGEWAASGYAEAGVACQDCHMRGGLDGRGASHRFSQQSERAVSILIDLPSPQLTRGGPALDGRLILQNTGAGHAFPTGSPYRGIEVQVLLRASPAEGDEAPEPLVVHQSWLGRTLEEAPPWDTVKDTRLRPGAETSWPLSVALPLEAPAGPWTLSVELTETHRGVPEPAPEIVRQIRLSTD